MVVTPDPAVADRVRHLATQAREPVPHFEHVEVGFNYRLSNLLAAIGRAQLARLPEMIDRRLAIHDRYRGHLADVPGVTFMPIAPWGRWNGWLTCIVLDGPAPTRRRDRPAGGPRHREPAAVEADAPSSRCSGRRPAFTNGSATSSSSVALPAERLSADRRPDRHHRRARPRRCAPRRRVKPAGGAGPPGVATRAQPALEEHPAGSLATKGLVVVVGDGHGVAPEAVEVGGAGPVDHVAGERSGPEPPAHDDLGRGRRGDRLRVGEVPARSSELLLDQADGAGDLVGRVVPREATPSTRWVCVWEPIVAKPVAAMSARPAQLTGRPPSGKRRPTSTKSGGHVERRRQASLDERREDHVGPVGRAVVEGQHDLRRCGDGPAPCRQDVHRRVEVDDTVVLGQPVELALERGAATGRPATPIRPPTRWYSSTTTAGPRRTRPPTSSGRPSAATTPAGDHAATVVSRAGWRPTPTLAVDAHQLRSSGASPSWAWPSSSASPSPTTRLREHHGGHVAVRVRRLDARRRRRVLDRGDDAPTPTDRGGRDDGRLEHRRRRGPPRPPRHDCGPDAGVDPARASTPGSPSASSTAVHRRVRRRRCPRRLRTAGFAPRGVGRREAARGRATTRPLRPRPRARRGDRQRCRRGPPRERRSGPRRRPELGGVRRRTSPCWSCSGRRT